MGNRGYWNRVGERAAERAITEQRRNATRTVAGAALKLLVLDGVRGRHRETGFGREAILRSVVSRNRYERNVGADLVGLDVVVVDWPGRPAAAVPLASPSASNPQVSEVIMRNVPFADARTVANGFNDGAQASGDPRWAMLVDSEDEIAVGEQLEPVAQVFTRKAK